MKSRVAYICDVCGKEYRYDDVAEIDCNLHEKSCCLKKIKEMLTNMHPDLQLYLVTWEFNDEHRKKIFYDYDIAEAFYNTWKDIDNNKYKAELISLYLSY